MVGKAEASATLTVHGKDRRRVFLCFHLVRQFTQRLTDSYSKFIVTFIVIAIVLLESNAVKPGHVATKALSSSTTWSSLSVILSQLAD